MLSFTRDETQNALFPPRLEIPAMPPERMGLVVSMLFPGLPARRTGRLLQAQDPEPAQVSARKSPWDSPVAASPYHVPVVFDTNCSSLWLCPLPPPSSSGRP